MASYFDSTDCLTLSNLWPRPRTPKPAPIIPRAASHARPSKPRSVATNPRTPLAIKTPPPTFVFQPSISDLLSPRRQARQGLRKFNGQTQAVDPAEGQPHHEPDDGLREKHSQIHSPALRRHAHAVHCCTHASTERAALAPTAAGEGVPTTIRARATARGRRARGNPRNRRLRRFRRFRISPREILNRATGPLGVYGRPRPGGRSRVRSRSGGSRR